MGKMSKSNNLDSNLSESEESIKIEALRSEVNYWKLRHKLVSCSPQSGSKLAMRMGMATYMKLPPESIRENPLKEVMKERYLQAGDFKGEEMKDNEIRKVKCKDFPK